MKAYTQEDQRTIARLIDRVCESDTAWKHVHPNFEFAMACALAELDRRTGKGEAMEPAHGDPKFGDVHARASVDPYLGTIEIEALSCHSAYFGGQVRLKGQRYISKNGRMFRKVRS